MKDKLLTGTINIGKEIVTFVCENFRFVFVRAGNNTAPIILPLTIPVDPSGYIWGTTNNNQQIAIYTKRNLIINHTQELNTWNYILFKHPVANNNTLFDGIRFFDGFIKSINPCLTLRRESDIEDELNKENPGQYFVHKAYRTPKIFNIELDDEKTTWMFGNMINSKLSIDEGTSLEDGTSVLEIIFNSSKSLTTLYDYYGYVSTIASFMTYRSNVSFERVTLVRKYEACYTCEIAECYIKNVSTATERKTMNSISVRFLSEQSFKNLVLNVAQADKKHKFLPVEFLPNDDMDFGLLTKDRLKNICSALEVEMDMAKISASKQEELNNLIGKIKDIIKANRKGGETQIPESTYNNIFNSIGHWGDSVTDRAIIAWDNHKDEISPLMCGLGINMTVEEIHKNIAKFVNARNKITHEGFGELDEVLAETAILLSALVYCMSLTRLEIEKDMIAGFLVRIMGR